MINWGIIGAGNIANRFAASLENFQDAQLYGVACRTMEKRKRFKQNFRVTSSLMTTKTY